MNSAELQQRFSLENIPNSSDRRIVHNYMIDCTFSGHGSLDVDRANKMITWSTFYPFSFDNRFPYRMRIGTLAHIETIRALLQDTIVGVEPEAFNIRHRFPAHITLSRRRRKQLRAMRLRKAMWTGMPLPEYAMRSMQFGQEKGFSFPENEVAHIRDLMERMRVQRSLLHDVLSIACNA